MLVLARSAVRSTAPGTAPRARHARSANDRPMGRVRGRTRAARRACSRSNGTILRTSRMPVASGRCSASSKTFFLASLDSTSAQWIVLIQASSVPRTPTTRSAPGSPRGYARSAEASRTIRAFLRRSCAAGPISNRAIRQGFPDRRRKHDAAPFAHGGDVAAAPGSNVRIPPTRLWERSPIGGLQHRVGWGQGMIRDGEPAPVRVGEDSAFVGKRRAVRNSAGPGAAGSRRGHAELAPVESRRPIFRVTPMSRHIRFEWLDVPTWCRFVL